jgi:phosphopantothenoylcysteine decarboxylase/phosphopantothenate--cysteine ligase
MEAAVDDAVSGCDAVIMTAAVSDFRPAQVSDHKLKKGDNEETRTLKLIGNPDILAGLGDRFADQAGPVLVGFALETGNLEKNAEAKLRSKRAHLIVANLAEDGFGGEQNRAVIIDDQGTHRDTGRLSKDALAHQILDSVVSRFQ